MSEFHAAALVLLADPMAQRMAVAWRFLEKQERGNVDAWSNAAGVPVTLGRSIATALRRSGICRDDGEVENLALQYIAAHVQQSIPKGKK